MNEVPISSEKRLQEINNYVFRMPSFSTTVTKALEICNNPSSSPNDLNRVISLDPMRTDAEIDELTKKYCHPDYSGDIEVFFAREGMDISI